MKEHGYAFISSEMNIENLAPSQESKKFLETRVYCIRPEAEQLSNPILKYGTPCSTKLKNSSIRSDLDNNIFLLTFGPMGL